MTTRKIKYSIILSLLLLSFQFALSQDDEKQTNKKLVVKSDSSQADKFNFFAYPYAFYTPETNFAVGASAISYFKLGKDTIIYPSKVTLSGYFTINEQWNITLQPDFYFFKNRLHTLLNIDLTRMIDRFWGLGNSTPDFDSSAYDLRYDQIILDVDSKLFDSDEFYTGITFNFGDFNPYNIEKNPLIDLDPNLLGRNGGMISGAGFNFIFDNRDNLFFPLKGHYHQIKYEYFAKLIDNSFSFQSLLADLRFYNLLNLKSVGMMGLQIYADMTFGEAPYFMLPKLGGSKRMRGYFEGRYRDNIYLMSQLEYRKQFSSRFMFVLFYGMGKVSPSLQELTLRNMHPSYGVGLRYILDVIERLNIRCDLGFGDNGNFGVYFAVEEAF